MDPVLKPSYCDFLFSLEGVILEGDFGKCPSEVTSISQPGGHTHQVVGSVGGWVGGCVHVHACMSQVVTLTRLWVGV